ncbi:hypothetical protein [Halobacterium rubrum]|uniref:hypothetical protein n=1 Tax=Halobacterium TaxID=2239 RepID=UPI001F294383|nr:MULTISPECIES: hypothetical protein [Halobacterium]MDH5021274.1 hypothetical protein [Halobacterium rubrum]
MVTAVLRERLETMRDGEEWGVFLVALAVLFLGVGYAGGSLLAGAPVVEQFWLLPVAGGCVAVLAMLGHEGS